ncbi:carbonic anhydrase 1 isoform X2 [Aethina tumida]|uniref:carbonic anhydrase 1 isoform X2 n=1 Tax=Aethina tumida TaxID=116153 RepID=UPI002148B75A|nr:carbonic anhydrase 1 isoform X2 [Aethina tumida]
MPSMLSKVIIDATWGPDLRPILKGGPLLHDYVFGNVTLRWGPTDDEGSEHMLDAKRYAMEMQLSFIKIENEVMPLRVNVLNAAKNGDLAYVSYFFMVTPVDNPYMEQIVNNLENVKSVYASVNIEPMPLSLLAPGFNRKYLTYEGSLTYPPCTEGVLWILQPEALTISRRQMKKFRKLTGANGLILNNTRPVQNLHERNILFYD